MPEGRKSENNFGGDNYMKFSQEQLVRGTPKVVL